MALSPGFQEAGHTSPCLSANWKACTRRRVSLGFLPTGRSPTVECRRMPLSSMMQVARQATPISSKRQPYSVQIFLVTSAMRGQSMGPSPPDLRGLRQYSMWTNSESMEQPRRTVLLASNSLLSFPKATISVGQTKVKSRGQKKRTTYLPLQSESLTSLNSPEGMQALAVKSGAGFRSCAFDIFMTDPPYPASLYSRNLLEQLLNFNIRLPGLLRPPQSHRPRNICPAQCLQLNLAASQSLLDPATRSNTCSASDKAISSYFSFSGPYPFIFTYLPARSDFPLLKYSNVKQQGRWHRLHLTQSSTQSWEYCCQPYFNSRSPRAATLAAIARLYPRKGTDLSRALKALWFWTEHSQGWSSVHSPAPSAPL